MADRDGRDGHGGRNQWYELCPGTDDLITAGVCIGPDLYVTTDGGQVRRWDGRRGLGGSAAGHCSLRR